jgi:hypothetical protein
MSGIYRKSYLISRFCQAKLILTSPKIANNHACGNAKMEKLQSIVCSKRNAKLNVTAINLK